MMKLHLLYKPLGIEMLTQDAFDSLPTEPIKDAIFYKPEIYGDKYRCSLSDYNYSECHKKAFDKQFSRIDKVTERRIETALDLLIDMIGEATPERAAQIEKNISAHVSDMVTEGLRGFCSLTEINYICTEVEKRYQAL